MKRRALFIFYDGTLIKAPDKLFQVDTLESMEFLPGVVRNLYFIRKNLDFALVLLMKQDNDTLSPLTSHLSPLQAKMLEIFRNEAITFDDILTEPAMPDDQIYDVVNSYVIGANEADLQLAEMLGCKGVFLTVSDVSAPKERFYILDSWDRITELLFAGERQATVRRITNETDIYVHLDLDGSDVCDITTGIGFFNHLLEQLGKHGGLDLTIKVKGDLYVDEHHTIEDTAIALGDAVYQALGNKRGSERYGYCLPMDDCLCHVALDFGGRSWLVWDVVFKREKIGDMPTEMFSHFFKSFSDAAKMNLNIKAEGENEHHKAEGIFKALAKAIKMAVKRDIYKYNLPSTKGIL